MTDFSDTTARPSRWRPLPDDPPKLLAWLAGKRGDSTPDDWPQEEPR